MSKAFNNSISCLSQAKIWLKSLTQVAMCLQKDQQTIISPDHQVNPCINRFLDMGLTPMICQVSNNYISWLKNQPREENTVFLYFGWAFRTIIVFFLISPTICPSFFLYTDIRTPYTCYQMNK